MANVLKIKRSAVAAKVPTTSDLQLGELAINTYDGKLYLKKDDGTASIVEVGAQTGYQSITSSGGSTSLTNTSPRTIIVTGSTTHTIVLPDVTTLELGWTFEIVNAQSTGAVTVQSSGLNSFTNNQTAQQVAEYTCVAVTGTGTSSWVQRFKGATGRTGSGAIAYQYAPNFQLIHYANSNTFTAGTNAQGQGVLTETINLITTTASNPSGVTLSAPNGNLQTRFYVIINKGTNPVNIYPQSGAAIDGGAANAPVSLAVGSMIHLYSTSTTQWYSTLSFPSSSGVTTFSAGTTGLTPSTGTSGAITLGGTLNVANGGTGATTLTGLIKGNGTSAMTAAVAGTDYLAPAAIGSTVQAYDSDLAAIAALTPTADNFIVGNGTTWTLETPAAARTSLGLVIGTNVQAWDADLDAIAAIAGTSGLLKKTAANTWSLDTTTYTPTNGTGATGTWGISISGSAASLTTSRNINGVGFNGTADILVPSLYDANYRRITNPGGAEYVNQSGVVTGALQITFPVGYTNTMMRMTIKVFNYNANEGFDVICGGYNYAPGSTWTNCFAYIVGHQTTDRRYNVRFGYTAGGKCCVYIGELASSWAYPQFYVTDVQLGYSGYSASWVSGWAMSLQASAFENVTATVTAAQLGYATTTNTAGAVVLRDGSGNFSAGTITATLSGNSSTATNASYSYNYTQGFNSNWNTDFSSTPAGSMVLRGDTSSGSSTGGPGGTWWFQQNFRHQNNTNVWGVQVAWGWEDNQNILRTRNVSNGTYGSWITYLNSSNYNSYSPTLTGTGASGTWGISISGNAANVTGTVAVANGGTGGTTKDTGRQGLGITVSTTAPASPATGDLWVDTN